MLDDLTRVADGLDVAPGALFGLLLGGFAVLLAAGAAHSRLVGVVACLIGVALVALGARAVFRPSRPFKLESLAASGLSYINTTRRLGAFYIVTGVAWGLVALAASTPS